MVKSDKKFKYESNMYYGAGPQSRTKAKDLRAKMTDAEQLLWSALRNRKLGFKFRRQHPIGIFIVDFYCHELKLVIEVDGEVHNSGNQVDWDENRTFNLHLESIMVIRFTNAELFDNMEEVISKIQRICHERNHLMA